MPMDFKTHEEVLMAGEVHKFRKPDEGETNDDYRRAVHEHVLPIDQTEAFEILFGVGWYKWTEDQKRQSLGLGVIPSPAKLVPETCTMNPTLLAVIARTEFPCDRCNGPRAECKGHPKTGV